MLTIVCRFKVSEVVYYTYFLGTIFMRKQILIKFGNRVREERIKLHLSQEKLAEKADVHRTYIGMIERAEKNITLENIKKVVDALGLKLSDFFSDF